MANVSLPQKVLGPGTDVVPGAAGRRMHAQDGRVRLVDLVHDHIPAHT